MAIESDTLYSNVKQGKVFYGWWVLAACFLIAFYTIGTISFGFTALFEPIAKEFGWSYAQVSLAASLRGMEASLLAPFLGLMVDRWGPRKLIFAGAIVLGLGMIFLSRVNSMAMYYAAFFIIATGMGAFNSVVLLTAVVNWFHRRAATASGIFVCGYATGGLLVPLVAALVDALGWRKAMVALGAGTWAVVIPLSLLVRHKPENYGYLPDGAAAGMPSAAGDSKSVQPSEKDFRPKEALKTRAFWHISIAALCMDMVAVAVLIHVMPYLSTVHAGRLESSLMATAIPLTSIIGRLVFGWLGDKVDKRKLAGVSFALMSLGLLSFGAIVYVGIGLIVPFVVLFSIGWGGMTVTRFGMVRDYFGRSSYGAILGFSNGIMIIGGISGPFLAGRAFDVWASYQGTWFAFAALAIFGMTISLSSPTVNPETKIRPVRA
ncbi:MAG: MFS transporter [Chloroflexi bacterium]|nr:MFS transporter [Chloroflexota bacterium]